MDAIILAGGKGTRLAPFNIVFPKPLVPLGNRPIIDIIIRQLDYYGFNRIIISLGYLGELIESYINITDFNLKNSKIELIRESTPLGTVGAFSIAKNLKDDFLTVNGDTLTTLNFKDVYNFHKKMKSTVTVVTHEKRLKIDFGVLKTDENNNIVSFVEKPVLDNFVSIGVNVFSKEVLDYIPIGEAMDFPTLLLKMLELKKKVVSFKTNDYWLDLGTHADYAKAQNDFELMKTQLMPF